MKRKLENIEIEELYPELPHPGDFAWRLIRYTDEGFPGIELYRATFYLEDYGDAETGPMPDIRMGVWEECYAGYGYGNIEQQVEEYLAHEQASQEVIAEQTLPW